MINKLINEDTLQYWSNFFWIIGTTITIYAIWKTRKLNKQISFVMALFGVGLFIRSLKGWDLQRLKLNLIGRKKESME